MVRFEDGTETIVRRAAGPRPLGAVVSVEGATATPARHRLTQGTCIVGSGQGATIVVSDSTVSRQHIELELVPQGVSIRDLSSRNGTYYSGQRIEQITLSLGGRVQIGNATVAVTLDSESLDATPEYEGEAYRGIVGRSRPMRKLFGMMSRLEGSLVTVLVEGESGVGKELVARALHEGSSVAGGPLVVVNCGAIPRDLVASELFGHKKGAFTGAVDARRGAFESADGGTLFLDELGELPLEVQPMLLRALESGEVRPVGGDTTRTVRARVVAATNRDLQGEVRAGRFRQDLYYRLAVVRLTIPPLRDRPDDIEPLAARFASAAGVSGLPRDVVSRLVTRPFPGNARELRNVVQAYVALGALPELDSSDEETLDGALRERVDPTRPYADQKEELVDRFTRLYLERLMQAFSGNQTAAAKAAGLDRSYLGRLLVKHGLSRS